MSELTTAAGTPVGQAGELEPEQPPLLDVEGRVRLSFSRVSTYRRCPREFRYAYLDRLPGKPSPHLSFGSSIHAVLEWLYDRKLPDWPTEDELVARLYELWDSSGFAGVDRDEQLSFYRLAQQTLRSFHRRERERFRIPAGTEVWFELPITDGSDPPGPSATPTAPPVDALVVGSIDRLDVDDDRALHVVDYKTGKLRSRSEVTESLQLAIYALACEHLFGRLPASVCLDFVVAGVQVTVPVDDIDLVGAREHCLEAARAIRAGEFRPTPNPLCGWCDYRRLCPAWEQAGPGVLGPAVRELRRLRRSVKRDLRRLRELEAGVERARQQLEPEGVPADQRRKHGEAGPVGPGASN